MGKYCNAAEDADLLAHLLFIREGLFMEVYPLSVPQINWETYIETFQNSFGTSPSSGLDATGLKLESPASFVATLDFENHAQPYDVLRSAARNMLLFHSFASFIYIGERDVITSLSVQPLYVRYRRVRRDEYYAIISGNINQWRHTVISGSGSLEIEEQEFATLIYNYLCQAGFQEIWSNYRISHVNHLLRMG